MKTTLVFHTCRNRLRPSERVQYCQATRHPLDVALCVSRRQLNADLFSVTTFPTFEDHHHRPMC